MNHPYNANIIAMNTIWDTRYDADHYVYGKNPNGFYSSEMAKLPPGKLLLPGEGEGRNAVYAASRGWLVDAFDQSRVGSLKAYNYAKEQGVQINYQVCNLEDFTFLMNHYDAVGLIFFHASPMLREMLHARVIESLKPGGRVILEAFHISQLGNHSGGPQSLEMLFDRGIIQEDFRELETMQNEELQVILDEGPYHQGSANVIRYIGIKKTK